MDITHTQLRSFISAGRRAGQAIFLAGAPGIGKSQAIREEAVARARELGREFLEWNKLTFEMKVVLSDGAEAAKYYVFVDLRLGQMDLGQLFIQQLNDRRYMQMKYLDSLVALSHKEAAGMLFLDEFNLASRVVMGSCYQLILDHGIGSLKLADGVQIMAAGNRQVDKCNITALPPALVNRLAMFTLAQPTAKTWIEWAGSHDVRPDVMSFLLQYPDMLNTDAAKVDRGDASFATPRSWELTSRMLDALAFVKSDGDGNAVTRELTSEDALLAASSLVGESHAVMFAAFCVNAQKLDIDAILADPASVNSVGRGPGGAVDLSTRWAVVAGVADRVKAEARNVKRTASGAESPKSAVVLKRALAVVRHFEEGELAIELCRFIKEAVTPRKFADEVFKLAHKVPADTPVDSPLVPAAARPDYEIHAKISQYADLMSVANRG
jgi:hypothetical protein